MLGSKVTRLRAGGAVAIVSLALFVAACGGSSSSSTSTPASKSSGGAAVVSTAKGPDGTYLADSSGKALYLWVADTNATSVCSGSCAKAWPPLTTAGKPTASKGAIASDLGTTKRSDGTMQVTYKGHPLYYYVGDTSASQTTGQGSDGFGAKWWLVTTSGAAITTPASSSSSSSSGSSSGY
jgi:predicted lipoprotein with Yx(FWY)xxD motif